MPSDENLWDVERVAAFLDVTTKWLYDIGIPKEGVPMRNMRRTGKPLWRAVPAEIREWFSNRPAVA